MSRPVFTTARGLLASAVLLAGCGEDFATGPEKFTGELDVTNWADTLVVGDHRAVTARVLDAQGREVLGRSIQWTIATLGVVDIAVPGSNNTAVAQSAGSAVLSVAGGTAVAMEALTPGTSTVSFVFADELFHETTAARTLTVVTAGIQLASAQDTTLTAIGDTALLVASALGHDQDGVNEARAGLGVEWARIGAGAVDLLGNGDSVHVVARQDGTDTLVVSHGFCRVGATCSDTVLVHVVTGSEPPASAAFGDDQSGHCGPAGQSAAAIHRCRHVRTVRLVGRRRGWRERGERNGGRGWRLRRPAVVPAGGTVQVCVRLSAQPLVSDCATVTITALPPPPPAGADLVVVNDVDMWSAGYGMSAGNQKFFENLVGYTAAGPRAGGHTVMSWTGAGSGCGEGCNLNGGWYTGRSRTSSRASGIPWSTIAARSPGIPADVKVIFIWMPRET